MERRASRLRCGATAAKSKNLRLKSNNPSRAPGTTHMQISVTRQCWRNGAQELSHAVGVETATPASDVPGHGAASAVRGRRERREEDPGNEIYQPDMTHVARAWHLFGDVHYCRWVAYFFFRTLGTF
jgi:hypothetical protein